MIKYVAINADYDKAITRPINCMREVLNFIKVKSICAMI